MQISKSLFLPWHIFFAELDICGNLSACCQKSDTNSVRFMFDTTKTNMIYETETSSFVVDMNFEIELNNNTRKTSSLHKLVYCPV